MAPEFHIPTPWDFGFAILGFWLGQGFITIVVELTKLAISVAILLLVGGGIYYFSKG